MISRTAAQRRTPPRKDGEAEKNTEIYRATQSQNRANGASNVDADRKKKWNKWSWAQGALVKKWRYHIIAMIMLLSYCSFELHARRNRSHKQPHIEERRGEGLRGNTAVQPNTPPREASFIFSLKDNAVVPYSEVPRRRQIKPALPDIFKERKCVPIHPNAENTVYSSCNVVHEIGMGHLEFINSGSRRAAFLVKDTLGNKLVLKVVKWEKSKFDDTSYEKQRKDGMAMEALTSSHYVLKIHAFCGVAQLLELGEGGSTLDFIMRLRREGSNLIPPIDKLRIAYQLSTATADLHEIGLIAHRDLCCHQFVMVNGVFKINDFHKSQFFEQTVDNHTCPMRPNGYPKIRPAEEYLAKANSGGIFGDKADVHMVGNVMYNILTSRWLFDDKSSSEAKSLILKGERSSFPEELQNSTDPAIKAMMHAIKSCWIHEHKKRPRARDVSNFIFKELKKIDDTTGSDVVRVNLPPLDENDRYTGNDFYDNFY